jgi:hypothetical protein
MDNEGGNGMSHPWFRVYSEMLDDRKIARAVRITGQSKIAVLGAWTALLCLANDSPERGLLLLTEDEPLTVDEIADYLGVDRATMDTLLDAFEQLGMVATADEVVCICQWAGRQFESDSSTGRVRRHRARRAQDETPAQQGEADSVKRSGNVAVTPSEAEAEAEAENIEPPVGGTAPAERKPSEAAVRLGTLERYFADKAGKPLPLRETAAQRKEAGALWWNPLREILSLTGQDVGRAQAVVDQTLAYMRAKQWDINDPKSIIRTARSVAGRTASRASPKPAPTGWKSDLTGEVHCGASGERAGG